MMPKEIQEIEIEKIHPDPLLSLHQGVTTNCSDFLGTALSLKGSLREFAFQIFVTG
jgi:hypothetical protein